MFEFLQKMLMFKYVRFEEGEIKLFTSRTLLLPADQIMTLQKRLEEELGEEKGDRIIFETARVSIKKFNEANIKEYGLSSKKLIEIDESLTSMAGLGKCTVLDGSENWKIKIENAPAFEFYENCGKVKDFVVGGIIAGAVDLLYPGQEVVETMCRCKGDPYCLFEPRKKI